MKDLSIFKIQPVFLLYLVIVLVISMVSNYGIIGIVNSALTNDKMSFFNGKEVYYFIGFICVLVISQKSFQSMLVRQTNRIVNELEMSIISTLRQCTFESYEKIGTERIYTAIEDVYSLSHAPSSIVTMINSLITVLSCVVFMFFLSVPGACVVIMATVALSLFYSWNQRRLVPYYQQIRSLQDVFFRHLRDLTLGMKELKVNAKLNHILFHDHISKNRQQISSVKTHAQDKTINQEILGNYVPYLLLFIVLFGLKSVINLPATTMSSFVIVLLYTLPPLGEFMRCVSEYPKFKVSVDRINAFKLSLNKDVTFHPKGEEPKTEVVHYQSLRFEDLYYTYFSEASNSHFEFGPINVEINAGEIVFITGGNGSGKSTFLKLLTGVYLPKAGKIYLNDEELSFQDYARLKGLISVVFADSHLFSENYLGYDMSIGNSEIAAYVAMMRLEQIAKLDAETNQLDSNLSKGQQKRLALIYALMEEKPIVVLDEWAADQDPQFRKYFYRNIVPELKKQNKTIIAVTHDEQYFDIADRLLKFDYGKLARNETAATESTIIR